MKIKILTSWRTMDDKGFFPRRVVWKGAEFICDPDCRDYDWLVVYDEITRKHPVEQLACPADHTILVTQEPPSIKIYNPVYTHQFRYVLTTQDAEDLPHPGYRRSAGALIWLNGRTPEENAVAPDFPKDNGISAICSDKQGKHTEHFRRYTLISYLQQHIEGLVWFGWGHNPLPNKYEAMDSYRYHLAIENHIHPYHWTEKLADAYLSLCLPFYAGDPHVGEVLPPESFIRIPLDDKEEALRIIRKAMADGEYEKRLPAIREARRLIIERYNLWQQVLDLIAAHKEEGAAHGGLIYERHALRRHPLMLLRMLGWQLKKIFA